MALAAFPAEGADRARRGVARSWETGEEVSIASASPGSTARERDLLVRFQAEPRPGPRPARGAIAGIMLDVTEARAFDARLQREKDLLAGDARPHGPGADRGRQRPEHAGAQPARDRVLACRRVRRDPPSFPEVLNYQWRPAPSAGDDVSSINSFILNREALPETHVYERETFDGKVLEVRTSWLPGGGFVRTFTDVTARKRREAEIAHAQSEYRTLFENAAIGIYRCRLTAGRSAPIPRSPG